MMRRLILFATLAILANCDSASKFWPYAEVPPPFFPMSPPPITPAPPVPALTGQQPCDCSERDDIKIRLAEVQAIVAEGNKPDNVVPLNVLFSLERKNYYERVVLKQAIDEADASRILHNKVNPFRGGHTDPASCRITIESMSQCMTADAMAHEKVHAGACMARGNKGWDGLPFSTYAQEEMSAYAAEETFLTEQLQRLERDCQKPGYKYDGVIFHTSSWSQDFFGRVHTVHMTSELSNGIVCPNSVFKWVASYTLS